jgi:hypothetical protein
MGKGTCERPISRPTILRAMTLERPGRAAGPDDDETEHRAMSDPMLSETDGPVAVERTSRPRVHPQQAIGLLCLCELRHTPRPDVPA